MYTLIGTNNIQTTRKALFNTQTRPIVKGTGLKPAGRATDELAQKS